MYDRKRYALGRPMGLRYLMHPSGALEHGARGRNLFLFYSGLFHGLTFCCNCSKLVTKMYTSASLTFCCNCPKFVTKYNLLCLYFVLFHGLTFCCNCSKLVTKYTLLLVSLFVAAVQNLRQNIISCTYIMIYSVLFHGLTFCCNCPKFDTKYNLL